MDASRRPGPTPRERARAWGSWRAVAVMGVMLAACAQGGFDDDDAGGGGGGMDSGPGPTDGGPQPMRDAQDPGCEDEGFAETCLEATDLGAVRTGERLEIVGLVPRAGASDWVTLEFPVEGDPIPEGGPPGEDAGMPTSMEGGGEPSLRFTQNDGDVHRLEVRSACGTIGRCGEGGSPTAPLSATALLEWTFTDDQEATEEETGFYTRDVDWPSRVYVRIHAVSPPPECGRYVVEVTR